MSSRFRTGVVMAASLAAVSMLAATPAAPAAIVSYTSQPAWQTAIGGPTGVTVFHFDGPTETHGKLANDPTIVPSYSSQGVDFLPFAGTTIYPQILRGQGGQITDPARDGLLGNSNSPVPLSDLDGRAIRFSFNRPERAVGVFFNGPVNGGDGGFIRAFDASTNLIGQTPVSAAGGFIGLLADQTIARVDIVNTFNGDIRFGIWDLQFSPAPEPASAGILISAVAWLSGSRPSRRNRR